MHVLFVFKMAREQAELTEQAYRHTALFSAMKDDSEP
jgi:hypothetical protein